MNVIKSVLGVNDAPPPPDYAAAAQATAQGNLEAAKYATVANRANQYTPYGSLTWQRGATDYDPWTQKVELNATGQQLLDASNRTSLGLADLQDQATNRVRSAQNAGWNDAALSARGQAFDPSQLQSSSALNQSTIQRGQEFSPSQLRTGQTFSASSMLDPVQFDPSQLQTSNALNAQQYNFNSRNVGDSNVGDRTSYYDASRVGSTGRVYDPQQDTNNATNAILSRISPQLERRRAATEAQLANQGITRGSEAWNNAQTELAQAENDAYTQAGLQGINLGMSQQGQTYGQTMSNRGALSQDQQILANQQMNSRGQDISQSLANMSNQQTNAARDLAAQQAGVNTTLAAQNQGFNQTQANNAQTMAAQNQSFGQAQARNAQSMAAQNLGFTQNQANNSQLMAAQNQAFSQGQANNAQAMAAQNQGFGQTQANNAQAMAAQQLAFNQANALRAAGLQEQNYFATRDMNQLNALRTGSQVINPTFGNYAQQQTTGGADMLSAANMGYQGQVAANNANNANSFGVINGISGFFK